MLVLSESVVRLIVIMLSVIMLSVIMLKVIMLQVIMLKAIMLSVPIKCIMLSVIMLNVVVPCSTVFKPLINPMDSLSKHLFQNIPFVQWTRQLIAYLSHLVWQNLNKDCTCSNVLHKLCSVLALNFVRLNNVWRIFIMLNDVMLSVVMLGHFSDCIYPYCCLFVSLC
jgi:hypothetical protein